MGADGLDLSVPVAGVLAAGVSLGGLLLVFSGFLFERAARFPSATDNRIINRFKDAGRAAFIPFFFALLISGASPFYWLIPCNNFAYGVMSAFVLLIVLTIGYGFWALRIL